MCFDLVLPQSSCTMKKPKPIWMFSNTVGWVAGAHFLRLLGTNTQSHNEPRIDLKMPTLSHYWQHQCHWVVRGTSNIGHLSTDKYRVPSPQCCACVQVAKALSVASTTSTSGKTENDNLTQLYIIQSQLRLFKPNYIYLLILVNWPKMASNEKLMCIYLII
jgi:hypothetical protein